MPVLRSREVVFQPIPSKTPRKRKISAPPPPPPPSIEPSTPSKDGSCLGGPHSSVCSPSPGSSSALGLGLAFGMGGRRRSLRLNNACGDSGAGGEGRLDLNVEVVELEGKGSSKRRRSAGSLGSGWTDGVGVQMFDLNADPIETVVCGTGSGGGGYDDVEKGTGGVAGEYDVVENDGDCVVLGESGKTNANRRFSAQEKGKGKLVVEDDLQLTVGDSLNCREEGTVRRRYSKEEKGKGKLVVEDDWLSLGNTELLLEEEKMATSEVIDIAENVELPQHGHRVDVPLIVQEYGDFSYKYRRMRERDRALEAASRFAYFRTEENEEEEVNEESNQQPTGEPEVEDWPGPFSTAMKIINDRAAGIGAQFAKSDSSQVEIPWKPSTNRKRERLAPSLRDLCLRVLSDNAAAIQSFNGIPDVFCRKLSQSLCSSRKMGYHVLRLFASGRPTEICLTDCSWATEEEFEGIFSTCNTEDLQVLQLNLAGRCLPDYVLRSTLACSYNSLPKLTTVSLCGAYRLSDDGLDALVSSAPLLCSVNLSECSLLTSTGIISLAEKLENVLRELILNDCPNINGLKVLPALKKLKYLEKLSVCGIESVCDKFVGGIVSVHGPNMKSLGFAGCKKLSATSMKIIGEKCLQLCALDLRDLHKLNDNAIAYLANCCGSIRTLMLQRSDCSDEAIAALLEVTGKSLAELSLNNLEKVGHHTALAISRQCSGLQKLDLSFCRRMSDEALGLVVDSCPDLKILKLFGCTQVTNVFLDGHSNPSVEIIGLSGSILKHLEKQGELGSP